MALAPMRDSLKAFLTGVASYWWFWAVTVLSTVTTFTDLYYPESLLDRSILRLAPAFGLTIFIGAFFIASYLTYKELYDSVPAEPAYDAALGDWLHVLYQRGTKVIDGMPVIASDAEGWQREVAATLEKHLPTELRMFQTAGDTTTDFGSGGILNPYSGRLETKVPAQVQKLRLIMGRYESRRKG